MNFLGIDFSGFSDIGSKILNKDGGNTDAAKSVVAAGINPLNDSSEVTPEKFDDAINNFKETDTFEKMTSSEKTDFAKAEDKAHNIWGQIGAKSVEEQVAFYEGKIGQNIDNVTVTKENIEKARNASIDPKIEGGFGADGFLPIINTKTGEVDKHSSLDVDGNGVLEAEKDAKLTVGDIKNAVGISSPSTRGDENLSSTNSLNQATTQRRETTKDSATVSSQDEAQSSSSKHSSLIDDALNNLNNHQALGSDQQKELATKFNKSIAQDPNLLKDKDFQKAYEHFQNGTASPEEQKLVLEKLKTLEDLDKTEKPNNDSLSSRQERAKLALNNALKNGFDPKSLGEKDFKIWKSIEDGTVGEIKQIDELLTKIPEQQLESKPQPPAPVAAKDAEKPDKKEVSAKSSSPSITTIVA